MDNLAWWRKERYMVSFLPLRTLDFVDTSLPSPANEVTLGTYEMPSISRLFMRLDIFLLNAHLNIFVIIIIIILVL